MFADNNKRSLIISAALFSLLLLVLVPLNLYFNNQDEVSISAIDFFRLSLIPALLVMLALSLVGYLLPQKPAKGFMLLLAAFTILVWLQSNLLLWDYGLLDGRMIDWSEFRWQGWADGSIWLLVLVLTFWLGKKRSHIVINIVAIVFLIQLIATITVGLQKHEHQASDEQDADTALEQIYRFSSKHNIVHLMLDGFQSDVFNDLIHVPGLGEQYRWIFKGFTYYPETLSVFPYTRFSIPSFLAGKIYSNEVPQDVYVKKALKGKTILSLARDNGYAVDIAAGEPYLENRYPYIPHDNFYGINSHATSKLAEAARLIDIGLFRAVPHFLKPRVYNRQQWLLSDWLADDEKMRFNYFKDTAFLYRLIENMTADRKEPVYKYIHIMNTHNPMVVKANCQFAGNVLATTRQSMTFQAKCTLDTVAALLQKMKAIGVYDNSLIIIHADHGAWIGNHRQNDQKLFSGGTTDPVASLASPLLAIKLPGADKPLTISNTLVSLADLPDTISDAMGWKDSFGHLSIFNKSAASPQRERFFRFYSWRKNEWDETYAAPIVEFSIRGSHYDTKWKQVNVYYPPGQNK